MQLELGCKLARGGAGIPAELGQYFLVSLVQHLFAFLLF
jgi:hypothetical protein